MNNPIHVRDDEELKNALAACGPGDVIRLGPGTYRSPVRLRRGGSPGAPLRIEAAEPGTAIFNGAEVVTDWRADGAGRWRTPFAITAEQRLEAHFGWISLPVQVWLDDRRLRQVPVVERLEPGCFVWEDGGIILELAAGETPGDFAIEVARHAEMLVIEASHVEVSGLVVTRCAGSVQVAGAAFRGDHNVVGDCEFSESAGGIGARFEGADVVVRRNRIHHNGQMGFVVVGTRVTFEENDVHQNDTRGFCGHPDAEWPVWECGGGKVAYTRDSVFRKNRFTDNTGGPGLWLDIDNHRNRVDGNWFSGNGHSAIMIEISRDNVVCNNIIADTHEHNYAAAGVLVQLSCRTRIFHNLFLRCEGFGVHLRWHVRTRDIHPFEPADPAEFEREHGFCQSDWMEPDGQYPVAENDIRNNVFVDCRRGAIQIDPHPAHTRANTSDHNFFWNAHNLHPMAGGHRLLEWQEMTGLDRHSFYEQSVHFGPLLAEPGDLRPDPRGPLAAWRVPVIAEAPADMNGTPRPALCTAGPLEC